jgi:adenylyltransferase/sulfurtransferase
MPEEEIPFEITVRQLRAWLDEGRGLLVLDVREPDEHQICRIEGARLVPLRELPQSLDDLDRETLTVVHCHHGPRSSQAVAFLRRKGFARATNLGGGIDAWSLWVDASVPRY